MSHSRRRKGGEDKRKKRRFFALLTVSVVIIAVLVLIALLLNRCSAPSSQPVEEDPVPEVVETVEENPMDFAALQEKNPDIYAWIAIPGTRVDYPVLQHPTDDNYYLKRNQNRKRSANAALFTQATYNTTDFTDPVTVIYGHSMLSGAMFGSLQKTYSTGLDKADQIVVTCPDKQLTYQVFAAIPFDNRHLLYSLDFTNQNVYYDFLEAIYKTRALGAQIDSSVPVTPQDHLLVLSTCLRGNGQKRYLVIAKQVKETKFQMR